MDDVGERGARCRLCDIALEGPATASRACTRSCPAGEVRVILAGMGNERDGYAMSADVFKQMSQKYCPRFGELAVAMGFITGAQLDAALRMQADDEAAGRPHRLLGVILFDRDWMSGEQIERVLDALFRSLREAGS
jgi:hypothetical protein